MTVKRRIFTHHPRVSLDHFTFCWWRHNRLAMTSQWPGNCDANTWQVISNSLDIDYIHGDIHGRSCKNLISSPLVSVSVSVWVSVWVWVWVWGLGPGSWVLGPGSLVLGPWSWVLGPGAGAGAGSYLISSYLILSHLILCQTVPPWCHKIVTTMTSHSKQYEFPDCRIGQVKRRQIRTHFDWILFDGMKNCVVTWYHQTDIHREVIHWAPSQYKDRRISYGDFHVKDKTAVRTSYL